MVTLAILEGDESPCGCGLPLDGDDLAAINALLPPDAQPLAVFGSIYEIPESGERWMQIEGMSFYSPSRVTLAGDPEAGYIELGSWFAKALGMKKKLGLFARIQKNIAKGMRGARRRILGKPRQSGLQKTLNNAGKIAQKIVMAPAKILQTGANLIGKAVMPLTGKSAKPSGAEKIMEALEYLPVEEPLPVTEDYSDEWAQYYANPEQYYQTTTTSETSPDSASIVDSGGLIPGYPVTPSDTTPPEGEQPKKGISPVLLIGGAAALLFLMK